MAEPSTSKSNEEEVNSFPELRKLLLLPTPALQPVHVFKVPKVRKLRHDPPPSRPDRSAGETTPRLERQGPGYIARVRQVKLPENTGASVNGSEGPFQFVRQADGKLMVARRINSDGTPVDPIDISKCVLHDKALKRLEMTPVRKKRSRKRPPPKVLKESEKEAFFMSLRACMKDHHFVAGSLSPSSRANSRLPPFALATEAPDDQKLNEIMNIMTCQDQMNLTLLYEMFLLKRVAAKIEKSRLENPDKPFDLADYITSPKPPSLPPANSLPVILGSWPATAFDESGMAIRNVSATTFPANCYAHSVDGQLQLPPMIFSNQGTLQERPGPYPIIHIPDTDYSGSSSFSASDILREFLDFPTAAASTEMVDPRDDFLAILDDLLNTADESTNAELDEANDFSGLFPSLVETEDDSALSEMLTGLLNSFGGPSTEESNVFGDLSDDSGGLFGSGLMLDMPADILDDLSNLNWDALEDVTSDFFDDFSDLNWDALKDINF